MSWLYTIIFVGLAMSSDRAPVAPNTVPLPEPVVAAQVAGDETEKFEQTYPLNANGRVNVSNVNGSITVEAWDRNEIKLAYVKTADTKERLADVEIKIESRADYFSVEADHQWSKDKDQWRFGNKLTVEFKIMAPRGAVLNEIETVNGSVAVSNFVNVTRVSAVNGSVTARNIRGTGRFSTVNGEVIADFDRLETGSKISLDTVNGSAKLLLPSDANATVKADSLNGSITNDFGLPVRKGKYVGNDMYGRLGNGDVQIKLDSVNGGLTISRKNDGKQLSPATNLLPQKAKSDEEWDNESSKNLDLDVDKMNKDIAKAVKESEKAAAKSIADAKARIDKIEPEIAKAAAASISRTAESITRSAEAIAQRQQQRPVRVMDAGLFSGVPRVEKKSGDIAVKGVPLVTIDAKDCSVHVRGWDKAEVEYKVTQFAAQRNSLPLKVTEEYTASTVTLKVENPNAARRPFFADTNTARIEIFVPMKTNLKITATGEIRVYSVSGDLDVTGKTEAVNVRDASGKLKVATTEGRIRLIGFKGELDSQTECGDLFLEGDFDRISARTIEGMITVTVPENPNLDVHADIEAVSIENLKIPTQVAEGHWRFGKGGPKYNFTVPEGHLVVRSTETLR